MSIPLKSRNHFNFSAPIKCRFLFKQIIFEYSFKQRESLYLRYMWLIHSSSNINEVIRAVLNPSFFYKNILHARKAPKAQKYNQAKAQNAAQSTSKGKKSLIRLFAFLCFLWAWRKENRKKRKAPTMLSIGAVYRCVKSSWTR